MSRAGVLADSMSRFNYQRFYDKIAACYGPAMSLLPPWLSYIRRALPCVSSSGRILEIGPGPGVLLQELAAGHDLAVGVDLSLGMIRQAKRRLAGADRSAELVQGDLIHLPFGDAVFDGVVMTFVLSAVPEGVAGLREVARVLRPGGLVSLVDAGIPSTGNRVGLALARGWTLFGDYMRDEAAMMEEAGLDVLERHEYGAFDGIRLVVGKKPCPHDANGGRSSTGAWPPTPRPEMP